MKIVFTFYAKQNLAEIFRYFTKYVSREFAETIKLELLVEIKKLKIYPELGQIEDDLTEMGKGHRRLVVRHYKIIIESKTNICTSQTYLIQDRIQLK